MKKNITINLFGSLYAIDEDAHELLKNYLDNMKRYFSRREGGDEIADDIEHRVAEIFSEIKADGVKAISIEHVQNIIHRIGNPEEMDTDTCSNENDDATHGDETDGDATTGNVCEERTDRQSNTQQRKLYRDPDDKMLGGVVSGISKYFHATDPLPWRIIAVLLAFLSFWIAGIVYLLLWALIPEAETDEDRLRMRGIEVTPQTLNENLLKRNTSHQDNNPAYTKKARGILATLLHVLIFLLKVMALCFICFLILIVLGSFFFGVTTVWRGSLGIATELFDQSIIYLLNNHIFVTSLWIAGISAFVTLSIGLYALIRSLIKRSSSKPMNTGTRITLTIIAILSFITAISFVFIASVQGRQQLHAKEYAEENRDGYYMRNWERRKLAESNWNVQTYENCNTNGRLYLEAPYLFVENDQMQYFDFQKGTKNKPMKVDLWRSQYYPEGNYRMEAIGYAKCYGAYIYAKDSKGMLAMVEIPENNSMGYGNMSEMSLETLRKTSFVTDSLSQEKWDNFVMQRIKDWSYVSSPTFHHKGGAIKCGITNIRTVVGLPEDGVSAWRFGLHKVAIVPVKTTATTNIKNIAPTK